MERISLTSAGITAILLGPGSVLTLLISAAQDHAVPPAIAIGHEWWYEPALILAWMLSAFGLVALIYPHLHSRGLRVRWPWYRQDQGTQANAQSILTPSEKKALENTIATLKLAGRAVEEQRNKAQQDYSKMLKKWVGVVHIYC